MSNVRTIFSVSPVSVDMAYNSLNSIALACWYASGPPDLPHRQRRLFPPPQRTAASSRNANMKRAGKWFRCRPGRRSAVRSPSAIYLAPNPDAVARREGTSRQESRPVSPPWLPGQTTPSRIPNTKRPCHSWELGDGRCRTRKCRRSRRLSFVTQHQRLPKTISNGPSPSGIVQYKIMFMIAP